MSYGLRTLLIILAIGPSVLAWVWFTTANDLVRFAVCVILATVMLAVVLTELACRTLWTFTMLKPSIGDDVPLHYRLHTLPQFSLAGMLWAMFWLSVCLAAWRIDSISPAAPGLPIEEWIFNSVKIFPVPTAIGALFGHTWRGFIVGIGFYVCLMAVAYVAMASGLGGGP